MWTLWPPDVNMSAMRRPRTPAPRMATGRPAVVGGVHEAIFDVFERV